MNRGDQGGSNTVPQNDGGIGPYVAIVVVALVIGVGLAVYLAAYRDEILAIVTQSPT